MAGVYITSADYEEIRKRIDSAVDDTILPDATIALDTYSGQAEDDVVSLLKDPDGLTTAQQLKVKRACILRCAAELVPAVRSTIRRASGDVQAEREKRDWVAHQTALFQASDTQLVDIPKKSDIDSGSGAGDFLLFGVADGSRGKWP